MTRTTRFLLALSAMTLVLGGALLAHATTPSDPSQVDPCPVDTNTPVEATP